MMRLRFIIPFVLTILLTIGFVSTLTSGMRSTAIAASATSGNDVLLQRMDQYSTSLYDAVYSDHRQAAFLYLQGLQRQLETAVGDESKQSQLWQALLEESHIIHQALSSGKPQAEWLNAVSRMKLTTDAWTRGDKALWLNYEGILQDDLDRLKKAWSMQTVDRSSASIAQLRALEEHADRIELAARAGQKEAPMNELSERIRYTERLLKANEQGGSNAAQINQSLAALTKTIANVFHGVKQKELPAVAVPAATPHPISWAFLLGAIISSVLTYTGWRKYKHTPYGVKPVA